MVVELSDGIADLARHRVSRGGAEVALSTREAELLAYLVRAGGVVSRDELLTRVWRYRSTHATRAVDMCVRRLRAKIEPDPSEPVHILTTLGEGYRFVPPSRPAARAVRRTAPTPRLTTWFGRDADLGALRDALRAGRLVTVLGGAGLGKTRLVRELTRDWPDPVVFCDLVGAFDADGLAAVVAEALGVRADDPASRVGDVLAGAGPTLVVLDNFEQLVAEARWVVGWLEAAPDARFVVTSRTRLGCAAERVLAIGPLPDEPAVALLRDRATAAGAPELEPDAARRVAARLEGIPLAIELAAGRLRTLTAEQLTARLDSHLRVLVSGNPAATDRHGTMRAAVAWSWDLLTLPERSLLATLSVFRGPFDLEAVEEVAVLPAGVWPEDLLAQLVDRSLVTVADGPTGRTYRLFECVREFAAEQLSPDAAAAARDRHQRYYTDAAERALGVLPLGDALRVLDGLRANLVAAWDHGPDPEGRGRVAVVLCELLARRGPHAQFTRVFETAVDATPGAPEVTARLLTVAGHHAVFAQDLDAARARLRRAEPLLPRTSAAARADAAELRAKILASDGDLDRAVAEMNRARQGFEQADMPGRAAWMALQVALLPDRSGDDVDVARTALDAAEQALRAVRDEVGLRLVDGARARWALVAGDRATAAYWVDRMAWRPDPHDPDPPGTMAAGTVALVEEALGRFDRALEAARHRAEARRAYATPRRQVSARLRAVTLLAVLGRTGEAIDEARACLALAPDGPPWLRTQLRGALATALLEHGEPEAALAELAALSEPAHAHADLWTSLCHLERGRADLAHGPASSAVAGLAADPVLGAVARAALSCCQGAHDPLAALPALDEPTALRHHADRRAVVGRAAAELACRSLRRAATRQGAGMPASGGSTR